MRCVGPWKTSTKFRIQACAPVSWQARPVGIPQFPLRPLHPPPLLVFPASANPYVHLFLPPYLILIGSLLYLSVAEPGDFYKGYYGFNGVPRPGPLEEKTNRRLVGAALGFCHFTLPIVHSSLSNTPYSSASLTLFLHDISSRICK